MDRHRLLEKLQDCLSPEISQEERKVRLDKVDDEAKQYMIHAEKKMPSNQMWEDTFFPRSLIMD